MNLSYAIGLRSPEEYPGVYQWRLGGGAGEATPTFTNWASTAPVSDLRWTHIYDVRRALRRNMSSNMLIIMLMTIRCVSISVGWGGGGQNGRWWDVACTGDSALLGVCERRRSNATARG